MNKQLVYKQLVDGSWVGNDGTKINVIFSPDDTDFPIYQLIDQRGNITATQDISIHYLVANAVFFGYKQRTGRNMRSEINFKLVPELFPPGTIVEVVSSMYEDGVTLLTVDYLEQNGVRSYCMVMKEQRAIRWGVDKGKMEPYRFNIINVTKIIKRGDGVVKIVRDEKIDTLDSVFEMAALRTGWLVNHYPSARNGEVMCSVDDLWLNAAVLTVPGNEYRNVSVDRILSFIAHGVFSRWVKTIHFHGIPHQIYTINKRKFKKWVNKYSHLVLTTRNEDEEMEQSFYRDDAE